MSSFDWEELDAVFGADSRGNTPEARACMSKKSFVLWGNELYTEQDSPSGIKLSAKTALAMYGYDALYLATHHGSVELGLGIYEIAGIIRRKRERIGLSPAQLAAQSNLQEKVIFNAENPNEREVADNCLMAQKRVCAALGLDVELLGFAP